jgi:hypothetical protein
MRIKGFNLSWLLFLLIIIKSLASCTPSACLGETTAFINAGFYTTGTGKPLKLDSITVFGIGNSSNKLFSKITNVSSIKLPLDATATTCGFVMKINKDIDTLRLIYSSFPFLISKECGFTFFYNLDSCIWSGSVIDTINIRNKKVTIYNEENIRIFY